MAQAAAPAKVPFHTSLVSRGQAIAMLSGAAIMLSIAMGVRQSLGLFQTPVVQDLGIAAAGHRLIETVLDKPAFRDPLRFRRCLLIVDGFYE